MDIERKRKFIVTFLWVVVWFVIVYVAFRYAISFLTPFLAAYVASSILRPAALFLSRKTKLRLRVTAFFVTALSFLTVGALMFVLGNGAVSLLRAQVMRLPGFYTSTVEPMLKDALDFIDRHGDGVWGELSREILSYVGSAVSALSQRLLAYVSGIAMGVPTLIIKLIFSVVATFYFTSDREVIGSFVEAQTGAELYRKLLSIKRAVKNVVVRYVRSYAIIMAMTFAELTAAFFILRVRGAVMLAFAIAAFDILPVVGTGTILIPWTVIEAVGGHYGMAVGLAVTYAVIFVVRNMTEPRIVGGQVGLHPLAALFSMFVGTMLFGIVGLFAVPITLALIVDLDAQGIIHVFNRSAEAREA